MLGMSGASLNASFPRYPLNLHFRAVEDALNAVLVGSTSGIVELGCGEFEADMLGRVKLGRSDVI